MECIEAGSTSCAWSGYPGVMSTQDAVNVLYEDSSVFSDLYCKVCLSEVVGVLFFQKFPARDRGREVRNVRECVHVRSAPVISRRGS